MTEATIQTSTPSAKRDHTTSPPDPVIEPDFVSDQLSTPLGAPESPAKREVAGFAKSESYIADALERTARAEAFDMSDILARYQREQGFSRAVVADHHRELNRFLSVCATGINAGKFYGMMGAIDELWHTFVIFTREYARFCDDVAGRFLHHVPEVEGRGRLSDATLDQYLAFLDDYERIYGEPAPSAYWPRPVISAQDATTECSGCNSCTGMSCTVH